MKKLPILLILIAFAGCAEIPGGPRISGREMIDGVEVWTKGAPSRPYRIIATESRVGSDNSASYKQEEELLAREAKAKGADAVVVVDEVMVESRMDIADARALMAPKVTGQLIQYE